MKWEKKQTQQHNNNNKNSSVVFLICGKTMRWPCILVWLLIIFISLFHYQKHSCWEKKVYDYTKKHRWALCLILLNSFPPLFIRWFNSPKHFFYVPLAKLNHIWYFKWLLRLFLTVLSYLSDFDHFSGFCWIKASNLIFGSFPVL